MPDDAERSDSHATSAWTVDTLHSQLSSLLEERSAHWEAEFKHFSELQAAADRRYEQRFAAQQEAMGQAMATIEQRLECIPAVVVLEERVSGLIDKVSHMETRLVERVGIAFDGHAALHAAHDTAHNQEHDQNQQAINRAEVTMRETAALHAVAHEREHQLAKEAVDKAHNADAVRFESLNEAKARSQDERATFATRDQLDDKVSAVTARLDVLDRGAAGQADAKALLQTNASRIEAMEKELATMRGRDKGIGLVWGVGGAVVGMALAAIGLAVRLIG